jgi:tetratricopeptide (TPR) repeat protein
MGAPEIDPNVFRRLASQMSRGDVILFTGAGFSIGTQNRDGVMLPDVPDLKCALWEIAFPGNPFEEDSSLGDVFDVAVRTASNRTKSLLEDRFRVDGTSLPNEYGVWFSMPWSRVYTLNVDDLDQAAARTFDLPRELNVVSALTQEPLETRDALLSVHLNGRLDDFPDVTSSQPQYGERLAQTDLWYQALVRDLHASPVLFIGTSLDEPQLWQHVELRGRKGAGRELRPGSYLVSPSLPQARRALLEHHFNVDWIPMTHQEFADQVLAALKDARQEGQQALARRASRTPEAALQRVAELRTEPGEDLREFLLGREPTWADLSPEGFAVHRQFENRISEELDESEGRALVLTGTGGAGKSTTLMRYGLECEASGQDVRWVSLEAEISIPRLRAAIRESNADVVLIDDLDRFGNSAGPLLVELLTDNPELMLAATVRASRYHGLNLEEILEAVRFTQITIPHLDDDDIGLLLDALTRAQRLGRLRGLTAEQQRQSLEREAGRQLLVAMIQATSGERFEEKVARECRDLDPETALMYAVVALATTERQGLTRHQILFASGDASNEALNRMQNLRNQHLLVETNGGRLRLRHRVVAERAVEYFHSQRQLSDAIRGLMFALASGIDRGRYPQDRDGRLLVRVMNHGWLIRHLPANQQAIRAAYDAIEAIVNWDHHFWLQRGSFEVEVGDLQLAQNFLEQARALAPEDYRVQTEWAYMTIKRAVQQPTLPNSRDRVEEAFGELEDAVTRRGHQDSYTERVQIFASSAVILKRRTFYWARWKPSDAYFYVGLRRVRVAGEVDFGPEGLSSAARTRPTAD